MKTRITGGFLSALLAISFALTCTSIAVATEQGAIEGVVTDRGTGEPLWYANVRLVDTDHGALSDRGGHFVIRDVAPGEHTLLISFIGYEPLEVREVRTSPGKLTTVVAALKQIDLELPTVVVTATRNMRTLKEVAIETSLISEKDLAGTGVQSLTDAVRWVPGVTISGGAPNGAARRFTGMIHGLPAQYSMILVDGQRAKSEHIHTGINMSLIPIRMVERIEVLKGPASALYGSEAFGGIINIITKPLPEQPAYGVEFSQSAYNTQNLNVNHGSTVAKLGYYFNFNLLRTDGVPNADDIAFDYTQKNLLGKLSRRLTDHTSLALTTHYYNNKYLRKAQQPRVVDTWIDVSGKLETRIREGHDMTAGLSYSHYEGQYRADDNRTLMADVISTMELSEKSTFTAGGELRNERFSRNATPQKAHTIAGAFVQGEISPTPSQTYTGALRLDRHPNVGTEISPSLGVLYRASLNTDIRASVARGFRAPSLQDLYEENFDHSNYYRNGNPELKPEYSATYSLGVERRLNAHLALRGSAFRSDLTNMIVVLDTGDALNGKPVFRRENLREAQARGVEAEARSRIGELTAMLSHIYSDTKDDSGHPLAYSPRHTTIFRLYHEVPRFGVGTMLSVENARQRYYKMKSGGQGRLEDYTLMNLSLNKKTRHRLMFFARIENLLDQEFDIYEDGKTLAGYGRTFLGGLSIDFASGS